MRLAKARLDNLAKGHKGLIKLINATFNLVGLDLKSLEQIDPQASGLREYDSADHNAQLEDYIKKQSAARTNPDPAYFKFLSYVLLAKYAELDEIFNQDPSLVASVEIKAVKLLNSLLQGKELSYTDIFLKPNQDESIQLKLERNLARSFVDLFALLYKNTDLADKPEFKSLDFSKLAELVNDFATYYSYFVLSEKIESKFEEVFQLIGQIKDQAWQKFLFAFYYRRQGDLVKAEEYILEYRKLNKVDLEAYAEIRSLGNQSFYPAADVLKNWSSVLAECDAIQAELVERSGLFEDTCIYYDCSDCCSHTFPVMSYTEYLYLKSWMEKNNYPIEKVEAKAAEIQKEYQAQYGESLQVLDKSKPENNIKGIENPHNFKYTCPFLDDGKCSCHAARPLLCRGFGLASDNDAVIKGCNYYLAQYQHNSSPDNERYVYDLRQAQMLARSSDRFLTKDDNSQELSGTIVAWLSKG